MRVVILGAGYVGLVSGTCIADFGHTVTCVEKDPVKLAALNRNEIPIFEPGLTELAEKNTRQGRLSFSDDLQSAAEGAEAIFIAVGTPQRESDGHADLSFVVAAAREIAPVLSKFTCIITKSTVPVGTGELVERHIRESNPSADFAVVSNPEFLREGKAIADFVAPDRVVIGLDDPRAQSVMERIYAPLQGQVPLFVTSRRNSELIKYAANAFLAMKIAFINEIADLCERVGADVVDVAKGIGMDHRIGATYLAPGPGYGGSCFPKDTAALAGFARAAGAPQSLVEATIQSNSKRKLDMVQKICNALPSDEQNQTVAILGLTFKPDTDDMREAPSLVIIPELLERGINVQAHDPEGMEQAKSMLSGVKFCKDPYEAATDASVVVLLTEWRDYRDLDFNQLRRQMRGNLMIDLRNVYDRTTVEAFGLRYFGVGR